MIIIKCSRNEKIRYRYIQYDKSYQHCNHRNDEQSLRTVLFRVIYRLPAIQSIILHKELLSVVNATYAYLLMILYDERLKKSIGNRISLNIKICILGIWEMSSTSSQSLSNFWSSPYDKSAKNCCRNSGLLYLSRGPSSLYGDERGACAFNL
jgi:hypothetical protein